MTYKSDTLRVRVTCISDTLTGTDFLLWEWQMGFLITPTMYILLYSAHLTHRYSRSTYNYPRRTLMYHQKIQLPECMFIPCLLCAPTVHKHTPTCKCLQTRTQCGSCVVLSKRGPLNLDTDTTRTTSANLWSIKLKAHSRLNTI